MKNPLHIALVALASVCITACAGASRGPGAPSDGPSEATIAAICATKHVDESSKIFPARNAAGKITRHSVTPSRKMADMGNLIFDADGKLLGHETGSEFPWDDKARTEEERARVNALFGGASVAQGETPSSCP